MLEAKNIHSLVEAACGQCCWGRFLLKVVGCSCHRAVAKGWGRSRSPLCVSAHPSTQAQAMTPNWISG